MDDMDISEKKRRFQNLVNEYVETQIRDACASIRNAVIDSLVLLVLALAAWSLLNHFLHSRELNSAFIVVAALVCLYYLRASWSKTPFSHKKPNWFQFGNNSFDDEDDAINEASGQWNLHAGFWWH